MADVDLDRLARGYAYRPASEAALARARRAARLAALGEGAVALDVGGGIGEHAAEFAASGALAVVVDRSPRMAAIAVRRGVALVGDGRRLPMRDGVADLVYLHASAHYGGWPSLVDEAVRVLNAGGVLVVWTFAPEHAGRSFLARWFPSVARIDAVRFPDPDAIAGRLRELGCVSVAIEGEREVVERAAGSWERAVLGGFVSTLQLLPDGEVEEGLARFRRAHPDPDEMLHYELRYRCVSARVPRLPLA